MGSDGERPFISIGRKIIGAVALFTCLFILLFSLYIYFSLQKNAIERYEQNVAIDTEISGMNIDYYIGSMIKATKSVYINHPLMEFLKNHHSKEELDENEARITAYFKSIYYASTMASQIYLAMPEENLSILYQPNYLKFSDGVIDETVRIPDLKTYMDVYVEPTHIKTNYGHRIPSMEQYPADELVFTIWLPISNLPADAKPIAYLAIDVPISFITNNCRTVHTQEESIFVVDGDRMIIASSVPGTERRNFLEYYPNYQQRQEGVHKYQDQLLTETKINSQYFDWSVVNVASIQSVYALTAGQIVSILVLFGILALLVMTVISLQILKYVRSLRQITTYMEQGQGEPCWDYDRQISDYITYQENDEIRSLIHSFQRLMDSLKKHEIQKYELQLAYTKSELKTMQAQINPHFIYNVIQCFATNALKDHNLKQYRMITSFGQMLHYAMVLEPYLVAAEKEMEYVKRYVALQQMRFDQQLEMVYETEPDSLAFKIPKMSIQPLVENAIIHGKLMKKPGSRIWIHTEIFSGTYRMRVADNGIPIEEERVRKIDETIGKLREQLTGRRQSGAKEQETVMEYSFREDEDHNHFIGIENVFSRLLLSFGACELQIYANREGGTSVEFVVPVNGDGFRRETNEMFDRR